MRTTATLVDIDVSSNTRTGMVKVEMLVHLGPLATGKESRNSLMVTKANVEWEDGRLTPSAEIVWVQPDGSIWGTKTRKELRGDSGIPTVNGGSRRSKKPSKIKSSRRSSAGRATDS